MKTNELMVADWVLKKEVEHYLPVRIIAVYEDNVDWKFRNTEGVITVNGIKPIPVTAGILQANGFENYKYSRRCSIWLNREDFDNHTEIDYRIDQNWFDLKKMANRRYIFQLKCEVYYVHELQHLLRAAGLNEMADSFVVKEGGSL